MWKESTIWFFFQSNTTGNSNMLAYFKIKKEVTLPWNEVTISSNKYWKLVLKCWRRKVGAHEYVLSPMNNSVSSSLGYFGEHHSIAQVEESFSSQLSQCSYRRESVILFFNSERRRVGLLKMTLNITSTLTSVIYTQIKYVQTTFFPIR